MSKSRPLSAESWPKALLHVDGDSFFASCEQAMQREYKGKPLVVGGERGIATAMSQEAKALGITRGMQNYKIKRAHPECIIVPSDYETYSLFSQRMFAVVRRHTPTVEEYSIDECFADITGLRSKANRSYEEIAQSIKRDLEQDLGITFSMGLAPTKVVAKIATGWRKPAGFTAIKAKYIHHALERLEVGDIWGIGKQTASLLVKLGVKSALEFATKSEGWVESNLSKPYLEIWHELNGRSVMPVKTTKELPQSINKSKTFTPPSKNRSYVFSQLSKNIENACIRMRRHDMYTDSIYIYLKTQDFNFSGKKLDLTVQVNNPNQILSIVRKHFSGIFREGQEYRATGVRFMNLVHRRVFQQDLFNQHVEVDKFSNLYSVIDGIDHKHGKHTVCLASSLEAIRGGNFVGERGIKPKRKLKENMLKGETERKRISVPFLGKVR